MYTDKPRDPERIDIILKELGRIWHANPDWRLGQLISNIHYRDGKFDCDQFQREDTGPMGWLSLMDDQ